LTGSNIIYEEDSQDIQVTGITPKVKEEDEV
jgi:hypothetical protein